MGLSSHRNQNISAYQKPVYTQHAMATLGLLFGVKAQLPSAVDVCISSMFRELGSVSEMIEHFLIKGIIPSQPCSSIPMGRLRVEAIHFLYWSPNIIFMHPKNKNIFYMHMQQVCIYYKSTHIM